jgi:hypothetical protein
MRRRTAAEAGSDKRPAALLQDDWSATEKSVQPPAHAAAARKDRVHESTIRRAAQIAGSRRWISKTCWPGDATDGWSFPTSARTTGALSCGGGARSDYSLAWVSAALHAVAPWVDSGDTIPISGVAARTVDSELALTRPAWCHRWGLSDCGRALTAPSYPRGFGTHKIADFVRCVHCAIRTPGICPSALPLAVRSRGGDRHGFPTPIHRPPKRPLSKEARFQSSIRPPAQITGWRRWRGRLRPKGCESLPCMPD